jgi:hypothetical protein
VTRRTLAAVVIAAAGLGIALLLTGRSGVEVRVAAADASRVLRVGGLRPGESIELRYRHSVERTPVVEVFRVEPDGLWFVEMRFVSQGAGLPTEGYVREGGYFVLRRPRKVGSLPVLLSSIAGHRLWTANREIDLVQAFGDGASVTISAAPEGWRLRRPR